MAVELFANTPSTTVSSGGTDAPASGTQETWTVASSAEFPVASSSATPPTQFHVGDPQFPSEVIAVTNVSGTTWTVTRGAEGTAPVQHAAGFTVYQVVSAGALTALSQLGGGTFYVNNYKADPTGTDDSTTAFQDALAAMPTVTVYADPSGESGDSAVYPYGTLSLGSGTYKIGSSGDIGNIGPLVNVLGPGRNACTVAYYGSGDCLRAYNAVAPADGTFDDLGAWYGIINGFTIDGTNAGAGATGLHLGDTEGGALGPDQMIQNFSAGLIQPPSGVSAEASSGGGTFTGGTYYWVVTAYTRTGETSASQTVSATVAADGKAVLDWDEVSGAEGYYIYRATYSPPDHFPFVAQVTGASTVTYTDTGTATSEYQFAPPVNTSGNIGLWLHNTVSWTENIYGRVIIYNCGNGVKLTACGGDGAAQTSFQYNDLTFKIYCLANQNAVVLENGASVGNGSFKARINMGASSSPQSNAALVITGRAPADRSVSGLYSQMALEHLEIQAETNTIADPSTYFPMTVAFGFPAANTIYSCQGVLSFGATWTASNWSPASSYGYGTFTFGGAVIGDTNLAPDGAAGMKIMGGAVYGASLLYPDGGAQVSQGDFLPCTLDQDMTIVFNQNAPGPQRKTFPITQAASGGPYTVAWPSSGSPSVSSPTVIWVNGVTPVMPTAPGAVMLVRLETVDGATWYGEALMPVSPATWTDAEPLASGEAVYNRKLGQSTAGPSAGAMMLTYWTAATSGTATDVITATTSQAASGLTLAKIGIYSVDASGDLTLLAATADLHSSLWTSTYTGYTSALSSSFTRVAGQRYALGVLVVGTTPPYLAGMQMSTEFMYDVEPNIAASVTGLSSLPSSVAAGSISYGYQAPLAVVTP